jgi:glycosyltransferase involved in cell wall biosynthesis/O-antigen/teichoic acid export membrane protein
MSSALPAPDPSARSPWLSRGVWTVLDQGSFAGANFVVNVLLARWLAPEGYGAYTVAYTLFLLVGVVHAGLLAEPMLVFGAGRFEPRLERYLRIVLSGHLRFALAAGVVLGLGAVWAWTSGEPILGHALAAFAVGQAAILFQWAMRSACYVRTRPRVAATSGFVYATLVVGGVAALKAAGWLNEATGIGLMATASLVAGLIIAARLGIPLRRDADPDLAREAVARHRQYGGWAVGTGVLEWFHGFLPFLLLPLWAGLGETGALRALFNLVLPILHLFHAASNLLVPAFVQAEAAGTRARTARTVALIFGSATLAFSVAVWTLGPRILHALYDGQYDAYAGLLWIVAVLPVALAVSNVAQAMLRAQERPSGVFAARAGAAGVAATLGAAAVFTLGVAGALFSDLLTAVTESAVMAVLVRRGRPAVEASGGHTDGRDASRPERRHVLVAAFACGPGRGSEPGQGWEMASRLAARHDVTALVYSGFRPVIEAELAVRPVPGLRVVYARLPLENARHHARGVDRAGLREQLHYVLWTLTTRALVRRLHDAAPFDAAVHASFMRYWSPSPCAALDGVPFLWGPVGGGETAPDAFVRALPLGGRLRARLRETVRGASHALPAVRETARCATLALATTDESAVRMRRLGAPNVETARASVALSDDAFARLAALGPPPAGPVTFVFMGRLLDWKGVALGLRAFARACADAPDDLVGARFIVVGDGPERTRLETLAVALPGAPRVEFRGALPRDEALAALAEAHVLVHPSLHDSGGYATLEALAAGRPVVCLALGGPAVQVTPEVGIAVPAVTPEQAETDLAAALVGLASDAPLRARLGTAGRARVQARFRWSALAVDIGDRLDDLLDDARPEARAPVTTTRLTAPSALPRPETPAAPRPSTDLAVA